MINTLELIRKSFHVNVRDLFYIHKRHFQCIKAVFILMYSQLQLFLNEIIFNKRKIFFRVWK